MPPAAKCIPQGRTIRRTANIKRMKKRYAAFLFVLTLAWGAGGNSVLAADVPCAACHAQTHKSPAHEAAAVTCQACHGTGEAHLAMPSADTIETFRAPASAAICSGCHTNTHIPARDAHAGAGVTCTSCHSAHASPPEAPAAACATCHAAVNAAFQMHQSHRSNGETSACVACHDPHAPGREPDCAQCHADVAGPYVYEHAASRLEGCAACHAPHGSTNRHLLAMQDTGALCLTCHGAMPQFHVGFAPNAPSRFDTLTQCTNCHVEIHGSNLDRNFLK